MVSYDVQVGFTGPDRDQQAQRWVEWMLSQHLADVLAAGAATAELIRLDGPDHPVFEARYRFADRPALDAYLQQRAPALRAEGLRLFPVESGVCYSRRTGEVLEYTGWRR